MPREKRPLLRAASGFATGWRLALPALVGAAATLIVGTASVPKADAKSPGSRYCFHGLCHRVGTLAQTDTLVGWRGYLLASYYDSCRLDRLNPCGLTSSGAVFRPDLPDNAASPLLPDGTVILAYNPRTGDASVLRITNAGPYSGKRKLDVSRAAAEKLGFRKQGVAALVISVLQSPTKTEASYVRKRVYPAVPGYLGRFETVDIALEAAQERLDVREDREQAGRRHGRGRGNCRAGAEAAARGLAVARPRAGDAALTPATGKPGGTACAGPASREPRQLQGQAVSCTIRLDDRLRIGPAAVSARAKCAGRQQLIDAADTSSAPGSGRSRMSAHHRTSGLFDKRLLALLFVIADVTL